MNGVLIRKKNLDTDKDTRDARAQKKEHENTAKSGFKKERALSFRKERLNQPYPYLDLDISSL